MPNSHPFITAVNALLEKLDSGSSINTAIDLANEILSLLGVVDKKSAEEVFESSIELPNAERYDSWFQPHPIFKSDRSCFDLTDANLFQAKFYWLKKHSRQIIAGGVHFTPNFEDEDFTHNDRYKVGIDFFLSPNGKSLQVVLSNRGNLRIVELNKRLNSTQVDIFTKWEGAGNLSTQEALHITLWESFKLKSVNQKFYDGVSNSFTDLLQHLTSINKDDEESKLFASRLLGRLLFCWFLRKKGIIDEGMGYFDASNQKSTDYYRSNLEKLFFLTLNTPVDERDELQKQHQRQLFADLMEDQQPSLFKTDQKTPYLNGGLFEPHDNDWFKDDSLTFPEGFFINLYSHFDEFNFTTDESSPEYELIAIDPEMLGRVFESLLATQNDETGQQARKAKGAFYTPREIVSYMCKESLRNYLYNAVGNQEDVKSSIDSLLDISDSQWAKSKSNTLRDKIKDYRTQIVDALDAMTVLDPACGSGAFPMGMLQLCIRTYERLESRFDPYKTKLQIIQNNIFGTDIEPMAVEIARLRAWLSLIVDEEDGRNVEPLPNLDFKFVCANSLIPLDKELGLFSDTQLHQKLKDIRVKYFNARKPHTKKAIQEDYYKLTNSNQTPLIADDQRTAQLKSFDPFKNSRSADFFDSEQMFGLEEGFDIVIGNPPYISHDKIQIPKKILQTYQSNQAFADIYCYFFELAIEQTKSKKGVVSYITSNSYIKADYGKNLRKLISNNTSIIDLINIDQSQVFDTATVNTAILTLESAPTEYSASIFNMPLDENGGDFGSYVKANSFQKKSADFGERPWLLINSEIGDLLGRIRKDGVTLQSLKTKIRLGIATGANEAFVLSEDKKQELIKEDPKNAEIIKPVLRGRDIARYNYQQTQSVLLTKNGIDVRRDYPTVFNYLDGFDDDFKNRGAKGQHWTNLRACAFFDDFKKDKIVWLELTSKSKFAVCTEEVYLLNSCYFMLPPEGYPIGALTGILNSKLIQFYMDTVSQTSGMGTNRWINTVVKDFPIPELRSENAHLFSTLSEVILNITKPKIDITSTENDVNKIVYELYGLSEEDIATIEEATK